MTLDRAIANLAAWGVGFSMAVALCAAIDGSKGVAVLCGMLAVMDAGIWWWSAGR